MRMRTLSVLVAGLLGGCGGASSRAPASDDATSRYDERLVGFWAIDFAATKGAKDGGPVDESILVVGRRKGSEKGLELVTVSLHADTTLESSRQEVAATTIGKKDYASVRMPPSGKQAEKPTWVVLRYEMPDADTLRVIALDEKAVAADVKAKRIAGTVDESRPAADAEPTLTVSLAVPTTALRAYLEQHGDGAFAADRPLVLRRVRMR